LLGGAAADWALALSPVAYIDPVSGQVMASAS